MEKLGFVILAHANLHRLEVLAMHLAESGCPVTIHLDLKAKDADSERLKNLLIKHDLITFIDSTHSEWGRFSLVQATMRATGTLLKKYKNVNHVMLLSGSCLPTRPIAQLKRFLSKKQQSDFIESISIENEQWVKGGLNKERFTLFFPFSWRRNRKLFDLSVKIQRLLKINRGLPDGIVPYLGSQWWCLTRQTLEAILNDPKKSAYDRFFKSTWIPDESYFQTLARKHSQRLVSRSLTWSRFDKQGKPFLLYDDHLDLITRSDCFMARKIWPGADGLYDNLLDVSRKSYPIEDKYNRTVDLFFDTSSEVGLPSKKGQRNQGRFPLGKAAKDDFTARDYVVLMGLGRIFSGFSEWLNDHSNARCHGNIFDSEAVELYQNADCLEGNQTNSIAIRNRDPRAFLENLIWNRRDLQQCFAFDLKDNQKGLDVILRDPNAKVILIEEAWVMDFWAARLTGADILSKAERLLGLEQRLLKKVNRPSTEATVVRFKLQNVLERPIEFFHRVLGEVNVQHDDFLKTVPNMVDLTDINAMLDDLRNYGFQLQTDRIEMLDRRQESTEAAFDKPKLVEK